MLTTGDHQEHKLIDFFENIRRKKGVIPKDLKELEKCKYPSPVLLISPVQNYNTNAITITITFSRDSLSLVRSGNSWRDHLSYSSQKRGCSDGPLFVLGPELMEGPVDSSVGHSLVTCELLLIPKPHDDAQLAGFLQQQGNKDSEHGPLADPPHVTVDPRILNVLDSCRKSCVVASCFKLSNVPRKK
uniref:Uncharacterized protein n=1 Tax=Magallana gigas TaxID=29159 RepID=K1PEH9_MAGGI